MRKRTLVFLANPIKAELASGEYQSFFIYVPTSAKKPNRPTTFDIAIFFVCVRKRWRKRMET